MNAGEIALGLWILVGVLALLWMITWWIYDMGKFSGRQEGRKEAEADNKPVFEAWHQETQELRQQRDELANELIDLKLANKGKRR